MATIKDVAKAAGVSVSAVSKYLQSPQHMREDTKEKIARAIEALGYSPNVFAQSLRSGKSGVIALMIPEIDNPYFSLIFSYIQVECTRRGMLPILLRNSSYADYSKATNLLKTGILDGAICYDDGQFRQFPSWADITIPIIRWTALEDGEPYSIRIDLRRGYTMLCEHLEQLSVKDLAYIGPAGDSSSSEKFNTIANYCGDRRHQLNLREDLIFFECYGYEEGYNCCGKILSSGRTLPQAIICESDMIAMGALKRLTHAGIRVPDDILLAGCDNTAMSVMSNPAITSIDIPVKEICLRAVDMLCERINGSLPEPAIFRSSLVIRTSTTPQYKSAGGLQGSRG